jgi:trans-aconitate methyltransferase
VDKRKQTIQSYDLHAAEFAEKYDKLGIRKTDIDEALNLINKNNPSVFEIGCGNGRDASYIITKTSHYVWIDASIELIKLARQRVSGGQFEVADVVAYVFPEWIDIIFAFASLIHVSREDLKEIFQRSYDSLNVWGIMRISMKSAPSYKEIDVADDFWTRTFFWYTVSELSDICGDFIIMRTDLTDFAGSSWIDIILKK